MLQDQSRVVRLPVNVYELLSKITKVGSHLNAQPDRQKPATYAEIGEFSRLQPVSPTGASRNIALLCCRGC
jgi:DNA-directed RNA polymerase sigma subunit (sigma70/sigma32)